MFYCRNVLAKNNLLPSVRVGFIPADILAQPTWTIHVGHHHQAHGTGTCSVKTVRDFHQRQVFLKSYHM